MGIKQSFENLGNSRSESNRAIVGGVGAVTLLRYRLNKCMLPRRRIIPRRRISTGNKDEAKKTTKNRRQFLSKFLQESGGTPSGPEALSVFKERSTRRTLRAEMMMEGIGLERG